MRVNTNKSNVNIDSDNEESEEDVQIVQKVQKEPLSKYDKTR